MGISFATVRVFWPMTQFGASGTCHPHSGHVVSVQYRKASARQPASLCSMRHSVTLPIHRIEQFGLRLSDLYALDNLFASAYDVRALAHVNSAATGLRSDPYASQPMPGSFERNTASSTEGITHTRARVPESALCLPSSRTSSARWVVARRPEMLVDDPFQASGLGPFTCSGRSHHSSFSS